MCTVGGIEFVLKKVDREARMWLSKKRENANKVERGIDSFFPVPLLPMICFSCLCRERKGGRIKNGRNTKPKVQLNCAWLVSWSWHASETSLRGLFNYLQNVLLNHVQKEIYHKDSESVVGEVTNVTMSRKRRKKGD